MKTDVSHIARLAHLRFSEQELSQMEKDMTELAEMVKELPDPQEQAVFSEDNVMQLREDDAEPMSLNRQDVLVNAPLVQSGCFAVPKTVE